MNEDTDPTRAEVEELLRKALPAQAGGAQAGSRASRNTARRDAVRQGLEGRGVPRKALERVLSDLPSYLSWEPEVPRISREV